MDREYIINKKNLMKTVIVSICLGALLALILVLTGAVHATTHTEWGPVTWGTCVTTGAQCGTDNGTQAGSATCVVGGNSTVCSLGTWVDTTYLYANGICPTGYSYQNSGNWNQRCHRDVNCSGGGCPPEHKSPTGCPSTYTQSGDVCRKVDVAGHFENPQVNDGYSRSCQTGVIQYDSCTPEGTCPTECDYQGGEVADGKGGQKSCPATDRCVVEEKPLYCHWKEDKKDDDKSKWELKKDQKGEDFLFKGSCNTEELKKKEPKCDVSWCEDNQPGDKCPNVGGKQEDSVLCPEPTQTPDEPGKGESPNAWHSPGPTDYSCHNTAPEKPVANFHLYRNGDSAKLYWLLSGQNAPQVNIYYKLATSGNWEHSVPNYPNDGYIEIKGLGNRDWTFAIAQNNNCIEGQMTSPVVDGNTNSWVLYR